MNMMNRGKYSGDDAINTPVDLEVERPRHGYKILNDDIIKCADCNRKLIEVVKVREDIELVKKIKVICPCGGESFLY